MKKKLKKPNILFILIDGLRPKNLGCYGYHRNTSPNIDSLAKKGVLFKNAFSPCNSTNKSFLSILGGRHILGQDSDDCYPSNKEVRSFFDTGGLLLQDILKKQSYKTGFLKKTFGRWQKNNFDYYFKEHSFEKSKKWKLKGFVEKIPLAHKIFRSIFHNFYFIPKKLETKIRFDDNGKRTTDEAIKIIKQDKKNNLFLWLYYFDVHVPQNYPPSFSNRFVSNEKSEKIFDLLKKNKGHSKKHMDFLKSCWKVNDTLGDVIDRYDTALSYVDSLIGEVIDVLKKEDLLENTIIFILADHGETFGEHGLYFTHEGLYDESINIPLIISGKNIPKNKKINALVQLKDISPTVLDLAEISYDPFWFDGKSLLPLIYGKKEKIRDSILIEEYVYGLKRRGIRTERYKYMESPEKEHSICRLCNTSHGDIVALYDLKKDSGEKINIAKTNKELLAEMKSKLDKTIRDLKTINEKRRMKNLINKIKH